MKKIEWIESAGGPLVMIADNIINLWSGIFQKDPYLINKFEDAYDFMDSNETNYGQACLINDYLGLIELEKNHCLVFGDEPMLTAIFNSSENEIYIARFCYYGINDSQHYADEFLLGFDVNAIDNWEYNLTVTFNSKKQFLFDAAVDGKELLNKKQNIDFLVSHLIPNPYKVFSTVFELNDEVKLLLHRLTSDKLATNITSIEKESIKTGIDDANKGKLNPHSNAKEIYGKWL